MSHKQSLTKRLSIIALSAFLMLTSLALGTHSTVWAQGEPPSSTPHVQAITYTVRAGDTLTRIGNRYGVTVDELVAWNDIRNPDLIFVDQVLTVHVPADWSPSPTPSLVGGPLSFTWSLVSWRPADPDYIATIHIQPRGGTLPYTFYHDGMITSGETFEIAWRRCRPKPGSVGLADATGTYVKEDYWLLAPYCPVNVEILEPEEGEHLKHYPRHFNITWRNPTGSSSPEYGIEIQVWEDGDYRPWKAYRHKHTDDPDLFFVPDEFPGDLGGRLRMWSIYGEYESKSKTPWRYFEFRVTY
jgi:LysM repeat protein